MGAAVVGAHMPPEITLDDLAAMNEADPFGHRYETSPEGVLSVTPQPDAEHAGIASELMAWLLAAGWAPRQLLQAVGVRVPGLQGNEGRIPDLTVWAHPPGGVWIDARDLVVVVEIVSPASRSMDVETKRREYAAAGVPRYWVVERDAPRTVTLFRLESPEAYAVAAQVPLAWLLRTDPAEHLG